MAVARRLRQTLTTEFVLSDQEGTATLYPEFLNFTEDVSKVGLAAARARLIQRLQVVFTTADREARARATSTDSLSEKLSRAEQARIPLLFEPTARGIAWRRLGRPEEDWAERLAQQPQYSGEFTQQQRWSAEIDQILVAFEQLLKPLESVMMAEFEASQSVDLRLPPDFTKNHLQELGYRQKTIEVDSHLTELVPNAQLKTGQLLEVWASPFVVSVYSPSEHHLDGSSSFIYLKQVVYHPMIGFIGFDQGFLGGNSEAYLQELLTYYSQAQAEKVILNAIFQESQSLTEEQQLLSWLVLVSRELSHLAPHAVLELFTESHGFESLATIAGLSTETNKNYHAFVEAMVELFSFELKQISKKPELVRGLRERIGITSQKIFTLLADTNSDDVSKILTAHKKIFANKSKALNPWQHLSEINQAWQTAIPRLDVSFNLSSVFDCISGGVANAGAGGAGGGAAGSWRNLEKLSPADQNYVISLLGQATLSRSELDFLAELTGKDGHRFSKRARCVMCGHETWTDPPGSGTGCGVCLLCELKDDWGMSPDFRPSPRPARADHGHTLLPDHQAENTAQDDYSVGLSPVINALLGGSITDYL